MSVPTFDEMLIRLAPVWQNEEYQKDIFWAGIFGSVSRNRAHKDSDVDILVVFRDGYFGEPLDLREVCIWQRPEWAWGHIRVEALISSRTVYGSRADVEHLRREAVDYLNDDLKRFGLIAEAVEKIKNQIASLKTYEDFIQPSQQAVRQECVYELRKAVDLLDIRPADHPIRTILNSLCGPFTHAVPWTDQLPSAIR